MILTMVNGYPDYIGYRQAFAGYGTGPASYVTGGDPVTLQNNRRFIDVLFGGVLSVSKNYYVLAFPSASGERITWSVMWLYAPGNTVGGTANTQVAAAANLSGETVQLGGFCGQW
jgi:hypothetical protein